MSILHHREIYCNSGQLHHYLKHTVASLVLQIFSEEIDIMIYATSLPPNCYSWHPSFIFVLLRHAHYVTG